MTSPSPPGPTFADGPSNFTYDYAHRSALVNATVRLGIWMHRQPRMDPDAIADWLGVPYQGKRLLEPINALWVDSVSTSENAARDGVVRFLNDCDFRREGDQFFSVVPTHSRGYSAWGNGVWKLQYDQDDAWVDRNFTGSQLNHGRIFPSFTAVAASGAGVYFTSGAFSRETGIGEPFLPGVQCALNAERCHRFLSFDMARNALNCRAAGWSVSGPVNIQNLYPSSSGLSYSTADHGGMLVFERAR